MNIIKAEKLALETWYLATIMKYLTNALSEECCLNEIYMIDLFAEYLLDKAEKVHYEFIKE